MRAIDYVTWSSCCWQSSDSEAAFMLNMSLPEGVYQCKCCLILSPEAAHVQFVYLPSVAPFIVTVSKLSSSIAATWISQQLQAVIETSVNVASFGRAVARPHGSSIAESIARSLGGSLQHSLNRSIAHCSIARSALITRSITWWLGGPKASWWGT